MDMWFLGEPQGTFPPEMYLMELDKVARWQTLQEEGETLVKKMCGVGASVFSTYMEKAGAWVEEGSSDGTRGGKDKS